MNMNMNPLKDLYVCTKCEKAFHSSDIGKNGLFVRFAGSDLQIGIILCNECMHKFKTDFKTEE